MRGCRSVERQLSDKPAPSSHVISNCTLKDFVRNQIGAICGEGTVAMVVSEAALAWTRRDKAPAADTSVPSVVQDASESSRASPGATRTSPPEREAYVTVDALKSLIFTMADAITHQVFEQVRRAIEAASSARPPPPFDYPLVHEGEPSHPQGGILSPRHTERSREVSRSDRNG